MSPVKRIMTAVWLLSTLVWTGVGLAGATKAVDRSPGTRGSEPLALPAASAPASSVSNEEVSESSIPRVSAPAAPLYFLNWYSVNGGGESSVLGTNFRTGVSVGQAAAGFVTGVNFKMGVGFWYGATGGCPLTVMGDVNNNGTVTSADIIALVNYVFKGGAPPVPCIAHGDINCNGTVTSADIIALVNYVFKGGAAPCNVCTIIPSTWSCP